MDEQMELPALYRVSGQTAVGEWTLLVKAKSPMAALGYAVSKNTWNILDGVRVCIEPDFYDLIEHEALAASIVERSRPTPEHKEE